jgi:hypothetical protein
MWIQVLVSVACIAVIGFGARFAIGQERFRRDDFLKQEYQDINRQYYGGALPDIPVTWEELPSDRAAETGASDDGPLYIKVDRAKVSGIEDVREDLRHESCHVFTNSEAATGSMHGPEWRECMRTRFPNDDPRI